MHSVHSFTDHSDYFVVSSNFSTKPKKVDTQARVVLPYQQLGTAQTTELAYTWFRGLRGYTSGFDSKITFGECVKTSMPDGVSAGTQYSENFMWSNDGVFAGHSFGEFYGVHFSGNVSFDATNITVLNNSDTSSAAFSSTIDRPVDETSSWSQAAANEASKKELKFPAFTVMKVGQDEWKKGYESKELTFSGAVSEGTVVRNYYFRNRQSQTIFEAKRLDMAYTKNFSIAFKNPNPPMHSTVHQRYYAWHKQKGAAAVRIHSECDWQLIVESTARDWITFDKTSGTATGPEGEWVRFTYPENNTGQARHVNIMLVAYPYDDKSKIEATVFEMYQSAGDTI